MINYEPHFGISIISTELNKNTEADFLTEEIVADVEKFHKSIEGYQKTPLAKLDNLAKKLGVKNVFVKDESYRYGLNAFKGLGGLYAIFRVVCKELGLDPKTTTFADLQGEEIKAKLKDFVFITTTDGNHGKGVAWASNKLGCRSVVFMPKGSVVARAEAIEAMGNCKVTITDLNYDDAVRMSAKMAEENGWYLVQDTAWEGYEEIPNFISQGYTIMAKEALDDLDELGVKPTHVFLQAGVGSMAGSVLGYMVNRFAKEPPITTIVEPETVACIYKSAKANDSKPHAVTGDLQTIMAGLNCGEPNTATWPILRDYASFYAACHDYVTARGMRVLASPVGDDVKVISGESGAVGVGLLSMLMEKDEFSDIRKAMGLDENSVVLCFSTEGNTDPEGYEEIVYDGRNFNPHV